MCVKNGMSIHDSSPTQYKGSHELIHIKKIWICAIPKKGPTDAGIDAKNSVISHGTRIGFHCHIP